MRKLFYILLVFLFAFTLSKTNMHKKMESDRRKTSTRFLQTNRRKTATFIQTEKRRRPHSRIY
jgi:hypothetical protein